MKPCVLLASLLLAVGLRSSAPAGAQSPAPSFFSNKTISIYVGYTPGGSYDFYARLIARHLGKHIPGNPAVVVQNMPGAGSLKAANYVYNVAPKDGTALGVVTQTVMIERKLKTPAVEYEPDRFNYIGRMTAVVETLVSGSPKTTTIEDAREHEVIEAGTGPTSPTEGYPRLLNTFAGTKFRIIAGFSGVTEAMLAIQRGEVDTVENSYSSLLRAYKPELDSGKLSILVQATLERSKALPDIPTLVELGRTPDAKAALAFYSSSSAVSRSLIAPPGLPSDRLKTLRDAFMLVTKDPELLAEVAKSQSEFDPASGEYLQDLASKIASVPESVVDSAIKALKPD